MTTFVIIPTKNRPEEVRKTLEHLKGAGSDVRIIVVDDSAPETREKIKEHAKNSGLSVDFIAGNGRGSADARNIALDHIFERYRPEDTDIVLFIDDDTTVPENVADLLKMSFKEKQDAAGIGGIDLNSIKPLWKTIITGSTLVIQPKLPNDAVAIAKSRHVPVKRLSGCFMAFRAGCLKNVRLDEQMIKYSLGEDLDFSHRVYKECGPLYVDRQITYTHRESKEWRLPSKAYTTMKYTYTPYMVAKRIKNTHIRRIAAWISAINLLLIGTIRGIAHRSGRAIKKELLGFGAWIRHSKEVIEQLSLRGANREIEGKY